MVTWVINVSEKTPASKFNTPALKMDTADSETLVTTHNTILTNITRGPQSECLARVQLIQIKKTAVSLNVTPGRVAEVYHF